MEVHPQIDGVSYDLVLADATVSLWPTGNAYTIVGVTFRNIVVACRKLNHKTKLDTGWKVLDLVSENGELVLHALHPNGEMLSSPIYAKTIYSATVWRTYEVQSMSEYKDVPAEQVFGGDFAFKIEDK